MSQYVEFSENKQDEEMLVLNKKSREFLGRIIFYPAWKQYVFEPRGYTVFNNECLVDIVKQINIINKKWRDK